MIGLFVLIAALAGCRSTPLPAVETAASPQLTAAPTQGSIEGSSTPGPNVETAAQTPPGLNTSQAEVPQDIVTSTPSPTYDPNIKDSWKLLPVVPDTVSDRMKQLYIKGRQSGNNRRAFSKIGDCETSSEYFLKPFEMGKANYKLSPYSDLQELLNNFRGSFERVSLAARSSFSVSSVFSSIWADPQLCGGEYPISCEYKLSRPAFALIMFGTNDVHNSPEVFEKNMRALIEYSIKNNVIPILATKADNLEGDDRINETIAKLAYEYEVPLWNFWRAMQDLPNHGLKEDQIHFTYGRNDFSDPEAMKMGWPVRNLSAIQVLDKVWRDVAAANGEYY